MKFRFEKEVLALLEGSVDIHIHSAPDVYPRLLNDVELALSAKENGMRAILVKNHYFETAGRARLASDVADFPVFGGIALNLTNGGLNKHAVKMALKMGAKQVWMPTVHADYFVKNKDHVANLATEIGVAGSVDDIDMHAFVIHRTVLRQDGDAALFFDVIAVHHALGDMLV